MYPSAPRHRILHPSRPEARSGGRPDRADPLSHLLLETEKDVS
jgi:hypothetical protein